MSKNYKAIISRRASMNKIAQEDLSLDAKDPEQRLQNALRLAHEAAIEMGDQNSERAILECQQRVIDSLMRYHRGPSQPAKQGYAGDDQTNDQWYEDEASGIEQP